MSDGTGPTPPWTPFCTGPPYTRSKFFFLRCHCTGGGVCCQWHQEVSILEEEQEYTDLSNQAPPTFSKGLELSAHALRQGAPTPLSLQFKCCVPLDMLLKPSSRAFLYGTYERAKVTCKCDAQTCSSC